MSSPKYFSKFPNLNYALSINRSGYTKNIKIKDYFKHKAIRGESIDKNTLFYTYHVKNGMRPDQIAYEEYGDERYYYVILQANDITDYYSQWPMSTYELEEFILKKYGSNDESNKVRHYETQDVFDQDGVHVLKAGIKVSEDYVFRYRSSYETDVILTARPGAVTNREYEYHLNELKSNINLVQRKYIFKYEDEILDYTDMIRLNGEQKSELDISDFLT